MNSPRFGLGLLFFATMCAVLFCVFQATASDRIYPLTAEMDARAASDCLICDEIGFNTSFTLNGATHAQAGATAYCKREPDQCAPAGKWTELKADDELLSKLIVTNFTVNLRIGLADDLTLYGQPEHWSLPELDADGYGLGDCEDLVLQKRKELIEQGIPASALPMIVTEIMNPKDEANRFHLVLGVNTDRGIYLLDSRFSEIYGVMTLEARQIYKAIQNPTQFDLFDVINGAKI